jgi:hypothetical protein
MLPPASTGGLELDSYYDGVIGGGDWNQITPAIQPGASFVARFTPNRAGTFIYHTHVADPNQLSGGVYGGFIVLEPDESFDAEHNKLLVIGSRDASFFTTHVTVHVTVNGSEELIPLRIDRGTNYRLRFINMAPNLVADVLLGNKEHPATWRDVAKTVPTFLCGWGSRWMRYCTSRLGKPTTSNSSRMWLAKFLCRWKILSLNRRSPGRSLCSAVQCSAVQCSAVQCSAVQCSAVQCSAVQ